MQTITYNSGKYYKGVTSWILQDPGAGIQKTVFRIRLDAKALYPPSQKTKGLPVDECQKYK